MTTESDVSPLICHSSNNIPCTILAECMQNQNSANKGKTRNQTSKIVVPSIGISESDFEPLNLIGSGSFGDVYLVRHKKPQGT